MDRRRFLQVGVLAGLGAVIGGLWPRRGWGGTKLRFLTPEADPPQIEVWKELFTAFGKKARGVQVEGEFTKWDDLVKKLATDIASGNPPEMVVGGSNSAFTYDIFKRGYLAELSELVNAVGQADFNPVDLQAWRAAGKQIAIPYGSQAPFLWYRRDLLEEKGLKPPKTWEDYLQVAEKTTDLKNGIYGCVAPYGRTWNTDIQVSICIWSAGGFIFDDQLNVVFDSPETREALKYYKDLARFSPPDAGTYGFREASNAFVSGQAATTFYWGRVLAHLHRLAPDLVGKSGALPIPYKKLPRSYLTHDEVFIYKTAHTKEAIALTRLMFEPEWLKKILWTVPGHVIPTRKSLMRSYLEHPWLKGDPEVRETVAAQTEHAVSPVAESPDHPFNDKFHVIDSHHVIAECAQRILLGGDSIEKAVSWGHRRMVELTKDLRA